MDTGGQDLKKQRLHVTHHPSPCDTCGGGGQPSTSNGFESLPSKEAVASMGLEAKVDMATHGHESWALTNLGAWRDRSLNSAGEGKSAAFIKSRQREARRAMLGGGKAKVVVPPAPVVGGAGADSLVVSDMVVVDKVGRGFPHGSTAVRTQDPSETLQLYNCVGWVF